MHRTINVQKMLPQTGLPFGCDVTNIQSSFLARVALVAKTLAELIRWTMPAQACDSLPIR